MEAKWKIMKTRKQEGSEQISFQGVLIWDRIFNKKNIF